VDGRPARRRHCTLRCVGVPCGFGRDRARKWGSEAVRLRVEVERAGMFALEPWQVRRHAWVEAMMRGRGEWDACGIYAGCACGGRAFGVWPKALSTASQDCLGLVVAQDIWEILRGVVYGVCGVRWQLGGEG
jgi:hypothetical protein